MAAWGASWVFSTALIILILKDEVQSIWKCETKISHLVILEIFHQLLEPFWRTRDFVTSKSFLQGWVGTKLFQNSIKRQESVPCTLNLELGRYIYDVLFPISVGASNLSNAVQRWHGDTLSHMDHAKMGSKSKPRGRSLFQNNEFMSWGVTMSCLSSQSWWKEGK